MTSLQIRKSLFPVSRTFLTREYGLPICYKLYKPKIKINDSLRIIRSYSRFANASTLGTNTRRNIIWDTKLFSSNISSGNNPEKVVDRNVFSIDTMAEKIITQLNHDYNSKNRVYEYDLVKLTNQIEENESVTSQQALLLIGCYSNVLPSVVPQERTKLLYSTCEKLKNILNFNICHYNEILRCYKENGHSFDVRTFIEKMSPIKPNTATYYLLLDAVCAVGDMNQAAEVLANMKLAKVTLTDVALNSLIEGHGKARYLNGIGEVIETMKSLKIKPTNGTKISIMKTFIWNNCIEDFEKCISEAQNNETVFSERQVMDVVKCLAHAKLDSYIKRFLEFLPHNAQKNTTMSEYIHSICIQIVYEGFPLAAFSVYKELIFHGVESQPDTSNYYRKFLRECIKSSQSFEVMQDIALDLIESKRYICALHNLCEAALYYAKPELAYELLKCLKEQGNPLRSHFFWPLLVQATKTEGEKDIFNVLMFMHTMEVLPDHETFMDFLLPNLNITSPDDLLNKFKTCGISVSRSLTPMLCMLLQKGKIEDACKLCNEFPANLSCDLLILPLIQSFMLTGDVNSLLKILNAFYKRPLDVNKDWVGLFLVSLLSKLKWKNDTKNIPTIFQGLIESNIGISTSAIEICIQHVDSLKINRDEIHDLREQLISMNNSYESNDNSSFNQNIPHPRDMTINQLEAHVVELESKKMNTRGVLRKLLQEYCRHGNIKEAKKIISKCEKQNVIFSGGMIANIFDLYVKCNELHKAQNCLAQLHKTAPNFVLDEFKMVDYATLLVKNKKLQQATTVLEDYAKKSNIRGGKSTETNCWRLLDAVSEFSSVKELERMMTLLTRLKFCQTSNILLGPLIRTHLNNSDEAGAVEKFIQCANKYKKTPLKHELLCRLLSLSNNALIPPESTVSAEKNDKYTKLLSQVVEADRKVHGVHKSQVSLIMALAEMGIKKPLRKYVLDPTMCISQEVLMQQCQRLGEENKITALENIMDAMDGIRNISMDGLCEIIMKAHSFNSDCNAAEDLWNKMQEKHIKPSNKFIEVFSGLLKSNKRNFPPDIIGYLDENTKASIIGS